MRLNSLFILFFIGNAWASGPSNCAPLGELAASRSCCDSDASLIAGHCVRKFTLSNWEWFPSDDPRVLGRCAAGLSSVVATNEDEESGRRCLKSACVPAGIWLSNTWGLGCCSGASWVSERTGKRCVGDSTSDSSLGYSFQVDAQSCSSTLVKGDSKRFERNERVALAFEYLFSTHSYGDKYGFLNSIKDAATTFKSKRIASKRSYEQAMSGIIAQFRQLLGDDGQEEAQEIAARTDALGVHYYDFLIQKNTSLAQQYQNRAKSYTGIEGLLQNSRSKIAGFNWGRKRWFHKNRCGEWSIPIIRGDHHKGCYGGSGRQGTWEVSGTGSFSLGNMGSFLRGVQGHLENFHPQCQTDPIYDSLPASPQVLRGELVKKLRKYGGQSIGVDANEEFALGQSLNLDSQNAERSQTGLENLADVVVRSMLAYGGGAESCGNHLSAPGKIKYLEQVESAFKEVRDYYLAVARALEQKVVPCLQQRRELLLQTQNCGEAGCVDGPSQEDATQSVTLEGQQGGSDTEGTESTKGPHLAPDDDNNGEAALQSQNPGQGVQGQNSSSAGFLGGGAGLSGLSGRAGNSATFSTGNSGGGQAGLNSSAAESSLQGQGAFQKRGASTGKGKGKSDANPTGSGDESRDKGGAGEKLSLSRGKSSKGVGGQLFGVSDPNANPLSNFTSKQSAHGPSGTQGSGRDTQGSQGANVVAGQGNGVFSSGQGDRGWGSGEGDLDYGQNDDSAQGGAAPGPERVAGHSDEARAIRRKAGSLGNRPLEGDSLWERLNKAYQRGAYPALLIRRDPAEDKNPRYDNRSKRRRWLKRGQQ